jgi:hypothetical protein
LFFYRFLVLVLILYQQHRLNSNPGPNKLISQAVLSAFTSCGFLQLRSIFLT